jgi:hypothetical protein
MTRIYIASPYGDHNSLAVRDANVAIADSIARQLALLGHEAITPLRLTHGWGDDARLDAAHWWAVDESLLSHWAQALLRLPGDSPGADYEEAIARSLGLPVYYEIESVGEVQE